MKREGGWVGGGLGGMGGLGVKMGVGEGTGGTLSEEGGGWVVVGGG